MPASPLRPTARLAAALFALLAPFLAPPPVAAQDATTETYKNWTVRCQRVGENQRLVCAMLQNIALKETGQTVVRLTLQRPEQGTGLRARFLLPLGVWLPGGLEARVDDGEAVQLDYQVCNKQACVADWAVPARMVEAMKAGQSLKVTFARAEDDRVTIPLSLLGFSSALAALGTG